MNDLLFLRSFVSVGSLNQRKTLASVLLACSFLICYQQSAFLTSIRPFLYSFP